MQQIVNTGGIDNRVLGQFTILKNAKQNLAAFDLCVVSHD